MLWQRVDFASSVPVVSEKMVCVMADRVLPSRERVRGAKAAHNMQMTAPWYRDINAVVVAYLSKELKTEAEWRATIDYEAVVDHLLKGIPDDIRENILEDMPREEWLKYAKPLVVAALRVSDG